LVGYELEKVRVDMEPAHTTTTILNVDSFELFSIFINSYNVHVCIFISTIVIYFTFEH
jgi:hypothetical protein